MSIHTSSYKHLDLHVQMCILLLAQNSPNTRAEWIDQRFFFQVFINASLRIYLRYCKKVPKIRKLTKQKWYARREWKYLCKTSWNSTSLCVVGGGGGGGGGGGALGQEISPPTPTLQTSLRSFIFVSFRKPLSNLTSVTDFKVFFKDGFLLVPVKSWKKPWKGLWFYKCTCRQ